MSDPFLGEIRMVSFKFAPKGWAFCDGQILPIKQNKLLYSLLGNTFGGDGKKTFALPDMRGRAPIHQGAAAGGDYHQLGQILGEERHTLSVEELPQHNHAVHVSKNPGFYPWPSQNLLGQSLSEIYTDYDGETSMVPMSEKAVINEGENVAHRNMMPCLVVNYCISLQGLMLVSN